MDAEIELEVVRCIFFLLLKLIENDDLIVFGFFYDLVVFVIIC